MAIRCGYSLALAIVLCAVAGAERSVALVDVNVVPMTRETVLRNHTVVVQDGVIEAIGPAGDVRVPRQGEQIDGQGKFLIPGLCDLHVHLKAGRDGNPDLLKLYAFNGVMTVLNMGGYPMHLELREQVREGELLGPTIFTVGTVLGGTINPKTYDRTAEMVRRQAELGYDFVKAYSFLTPEAYDGAMDEAAKHGLPVVGHAVRSIPFEQGLERGQHLAHMEEILYGYFKEDLDAERIPDVVSKIKDAGIGVIATMVIYHHIIKQVEDVDTMLASEGIEYVPQKLTREWQPDRNRYLERFDTEKVERVLKPAFAFQQKLLLALHEAGVPILVGTDSPIPIVVPGFSIHQELQELVDAGLTPYESLRAGTAAAAEFLGGGDVFGTIETGKRADLVLLDANPLEDVGHSRKIAGVMVRGRWIPREDIDSSLSDLR